MEARAGTSRLWRGLDVVDCLADDVSGFWVEAAFLAATALASLSCSRSGFRFVDADLEGVGLGFVDEDASEEGAAAGEAAGPVSEAAVVC